MSGKLKLILFFLFLCVFYSGTSIAQTENNPKENSNTENTEETPTVGESAPEDGKKSRKSRKNKEGDTQGGGTQEDLDAINEKAVPKEAQEYMKKMEKAKSEKAKKDKVTRKMVEKKNKQRLSKASKKVQAKKKAYNKAHK